MHRKAESQREQGYPVRRASHAGRQAGHHWRWGYHQGKDRAGVVLMLAALMLVAAGRAEAERGCCERPGKAAGCEATVVAVVVAVVVVVVVVVVIGVRGLARLPPSYSTCVLMR